MRLTSPLNQISNLWLSPKRNQWLQIVIIIGLLLIVAAISYKGSVRQLTLLIILLMAGATVLVLISQPNLGFIFLILGGAFISFTGPAGLNVAVLIVAMMLALWFLDMFIVKRHFSFVSSSPMRPLFFFLLISFLSLFMGQFDWFTFGGQAPFDAQLGGFAIFFLSGGLFILVANLIRDLRWLKTITWIFIAIGAAYILGRALQLPFIDSIYMHGFTAGSMFWTWLVALVFSQALLNQQLHPRWRKILFGLLIITAYVAIVQAGSWKSGWMPPLAAVAAIIAIRYWKLAIYLSPLALIAAYFLITDAIASEQYSWGTRIDAWLIVTEITRVSPILGLGFANYYWYTPLFPIRGWRVSFNSHSQLVDIFAQMGILGLLSFFWFVGELGRLGWRIRNQVGDGFARAYIYGALGGLAGTLFASFLVDWVLPFVYNIGLQGFRASLLPWMFLGGMVSVEQIYRRKASEESKID